MDTAVTPSSPAIMCAAVRAAFSHGINKLVKKKAFFLYVVTVTGSISGVYVIYIYKLKVLFINV